MSWSRRNFAPVLFLSIDGQDCSDLLRITTSFNYKATTAKGAETKWVMRNDDRRLLDDPRTFTNKVWKFRFGFFNDLSPIITGIVREVSPVYADKRVVTFTLYDASLNISQGSGAKSWGSITSSEIARRIAKANNMEPVVDESNDRPKKAFVQPASVNDLQYLRDLAAEIDFEVFVDGTPPRLYYRRKPYEQQPHRTLIYYDDPSEFAYVKSFSPKVKNLGPLSTNVSKANSGKGDKKDDGKNAKSTQGKDAALAGYVAIDGDSGKSSHVQGKTAIDIGDQAVAMLGASAAGIAGPAVGATLLAVKPVSQAREAVTKAAPSGANATALAASARSQILDQSNEASSDHPLTASLIFGRVYVWAGLEKQINGRWYAEEVTCQISGSGASTSVGWKRNAKGTGTTKATKQNTQDSKEADKSFLGWSPAGNGPFVDHTGASGKKALVIDGDSGEQKFLSFLTTQK